jgi:HD-like signal output (HDOD) protein
MGLFGLFKRREDPRKELRALLSGYELPSFPGLVMEALSLLRDPDSLMADVAKRLEADPGIHVKVLQMVNSAAFALANKVTNVHRAVTLLGRSRLETLILTHAVSKTISKDTIPGFDIKQFWFASARRAFVARGLASRLHPATQMEAFTAGLLQDMAVPVLAKVRAEHYPSILDEWRGDRVGLDVLERDRLGYDHTAVGMLMAEEWGLPDSLVVAISGHHRDQEGLPPPEPSVRLVSLLSDLEIADGSRFVQRCQELSIFSPRASHPDRAPEEILRLVEEATAEAAEFAELLA